MVSRNGKAARVFLTAKLLSMAVAVLGVGLAAANGHAQTVAPAQPAAGAGFSYFAVPGYWSLSRKDVQEEIGLTAEQLKSLNEISQKYNEAIRQSYAVLGKSPEDVRKLSAEERRKKLAEIAAENEKRMEEARKQVDAVLAPGQARKLVKIELRPQALYYLLSSPSAPLNLTDEQKEKLKQNRDEMQKKMADLQKQIHAVQEKAGADALELLTPEQLDKLRELHGKGFAIRGAGAQVTERPKKLAPEE